MCIFYGETKQLKSKKASTVLRNMNLSILSQYNNKRITFVYVLNIYQNMVNFRMIKVKKTQI